MTKLTPPPPVVDLKGVYKYHYTEALETAALNGIDLSIQPGEFVAIMGPLGQWQIHPAQRDRLDR